VSVCVCVCLCVCVCVCARARARASLNLFCNMWKRLGVGFVMCGCFVKVIFVLARIYCVLYCLYYVFVLFRLCIFILICFVCTSVRNTATE
jgi:hypothetical protein